MSSNPNDRDFNPEDRRKHLEFIQAVIGRLSHSSGVAKGWSLTIAGAAFGFSALNRTWYLSLLGLAVIITFSLLDMYYLYEERLFRRLYRGVCQGTVPSFSMNKDMFKAQESKRDTYKSWSVLGFYSPLTLAGLAVTGIALLSGGEHATDRGPGSHGRCKSQSIQTNIVGTPGINTHRWTCH
jgi:hypothetical protein